MHRDARRRTDAQTHAGTRIHTHTGRQTHALPAVWLAPWHDQPRRARSDRNGRRGESQEKRDRGGKRDQKQAGEDGGYRVLGAASWIDTPLAK